jgi:fructosamine-3-kinase
VSLPQGASDVRRLGGGNINEAFRVVLADGREAFVKTREDSAPGEYAAEAASLEWLGEPDALRTPQVLDVDRRYLALEWVEPGRLDDAGEEQLGRGLARTHLAGAPAFGAFSGASGVAHFGSLALSNEPAPDWPSFYAERRLLPLARLARERDALTPTGADAVERMCERVRELAGTAEPAARLHGDLWWGNVLADSAGQPWLIDPSSYGGHREVDLAMLALFGRSTERVLAAYEEIAPLTDGWRERVELYQLLPLLIHALLFAGSYSARAEQAARRYAG